MRFHKSQLPFPDGRALLPTLSTGTQATALELKQAGCPFLLSQRHENTKFMQYYSNRFQTREGASTLKFSEHPATCGLSESWQGFTLAKSVFPVPGGPYIRIFLYRLLFFFVFLVAMAMSLTRASNCGCKKRVKRKEQKVPRDLHLAAPQVSTSKQAALLQSQLFKP